MNGKGFTEYWDKRREEGLTKIAADGSFAEHAICIDPASKCWLWRGGKPGQSPQVSVKGGPRHPRRYAYEHKYGAVEPRLYVVAECGNSLCVNPDHAGVRSSPSSAFDRVPPDIALAIAANDYEATSVLVRRYGVSATSVLKIRGAMGIIPPRDTTGIRDMWRERAEYHPPPGTKLRDWTIFRQYILGIPLYQIGDQMGMSRQRAFQVVKEVVARLEREGAHGPQGE